MKRSSLHSVNFCSICKKKVEDYGLPAFKLLDTICYYWIENIPVFIDMDDEYTWKRTRPVLAYLESKQYIISTKIGPSMLSILPTEQISSEQGKGCFCWCKQLEQKEVF